ncbi:NAD(P)-binding domain-containing protein [Curtobacterium flaccumfaciens pv. flaccumfaciens]|uniref:NAD(P)/FAD-dependent oxidoreductase n=1 Tax=Curtobacterium poinsettiae TaxID=159612 RepID=UPI00217E6FDB|nr:NAD(P)/FAD-dependent oxidoreductase [Curtobacterium flaccumfaciens]MCS6576213.1 NAD(P)-binding domain-containing protein [Curtobacterium flaccumfaciens pv. flaccumfaciens]
MPAPHPTETLDALVVGAGPAGIGTGLALHAVDGLLFGVVDRGVVGDTFQRWPKHQRFLTPSFTGNGFGATDLNAVHPRTSPAYSLATDYPSGPEYARYLRGVVAAFHLPTLPDTEVEHIEPDDDGFRVATSRGPVVARNVVWAGGEFSDPTLPRCAGTSLGVHASAEAAWVARPGHVVVVGGFESGIDLACHHVEQGATVTVVDPSHPWDAGSGSDPSFRLAPRTRQRLAVARASGRLTLVDDGQVTGIKRSGDGFSVGVAGRSALVADAPPILATGYGPGLGPAASLFDTRADGWPLLTEDDESTTTPGLFLAGTALRHGGLQFCFVYKFRQRFAHVARVIGERAGRDCGALQEWDDAGMLTDDLSCCGVECAC